MPFIRAKQASGYYDAGIVRRVFYEFENIEDEIEPFYLNTYELAQVIQGKEALGKVRPVREISDSAFYYYAVTTKGKLTITRKSLLQHLYSGNPTHIGNVVILLSRKIWTWSLTIYTENTQKTSKDIYPYYRDGIRHGACKSLYKAAQIGLTNLFQCRKDILPKLVKLLDSPDQLLFKLSGGPGLVAAYKP